MNNIYRVVWNASMELWQAVSEIGSSGKKTKSQSTGAPGTTVKSFAISAVSMLCMAHAGAQTATLPVIKDATDTRVTTADKLMTINQDTARAVFNWESFNVGTGHTVNFVQPSTSAIALNRVVGTNGTDMTRSLIDGTITANGQIFLINPAGITFGKGSQVNVGGIVASTRDLDMTDEAFLASTESKYTFKAGTSTASVINNGAITGTSYVALIGAEIINTPDTGDATTDGILKAPNVLLAAGDEVLLQFDLNGTPAISVTKTAIDALIENGGLIQAAGGKIYLTAAATDELLTSAINNTGVIEATTLDSVGGEIRLSGSATLTNSGSLTAKTIDLSAGAITLGKDGKLDAATGVVDGSVTLTATTGALSNSGSIAAKTIDLTADVGSITLTVDSVLDAATDIADGSVTLTATTGALNNAGSIKAKTINLSAEIGAITLHSTSVLDAATGITDGTVTVTATAGDLSNAGSIAAKTINLTADAGSITLATDSKLDAATGITGGTATLTATEGALSNEGSISAGAVTLTGDSITVAADATVVAKAGKADLTATKAMTINGTVQSTADTGGSITLSANSISLGATSLLDASDAATAGTVTTTSAKLTAATGAQVKTLKDATSLGTWTVTAGDVYLGGEAPTDFDVAHSVNLLSGASTVDTKVLIGDLATVKLAAKDKDTAADNTNLTLTKGWNIYVNGALTKPDAVKGDIGSSKDVSQPQNATLTLTADRDIFIDEAITSEGNRGRLNVVLKASGAVNFGEAGKVITDGGNFYVGSVATSGIATDTVTAYGQDFNMAAKSSVNVGGGHFAVNVERDIKIDGTVTKSGFSGWNNAQVKGVQNGSYWGDGNNTTNYNSAILNAGRDILGAGSLVGTGYNVTASVTAGRNIGDATTPLTITGASTLNVTNATGASYLSNPSGYYNTINLTTKTTTEGIQSIVMADGRKVVATAVAAVGTTTPATLTIATDGVNANNIGNLSIQAPNLILDPGAIKSSSGTLTVDVNDPAKNNGDGTTLVLRALSGVSDYGFIKASAAAKSTDTAEINIPNGTVTLEALNIGTEVSGAAEALEFKQAPEINTNTLNVNNYGGSTWIANSSYNTLNFKILDSSGTSVGRHHILSTNGDFFNVETTSDKQLVVYSIDRDTLLAQTDPLSINGRMSGVYTRSTDKAHKNLTLDTGSGGSARDLIFMDDAVDLGYASLSLTAQGGKSVLGYSAKLIQDDTQTFATTLGSTSTAYATETIPHLTVGNLNIDLKSSGSTIGGTDNDLKVSKGGEEGDPGAATNRLNIVNQGGNITLHELKAEHFKDITITDGTGNTAHKVDLDLFHNQGVLEQLVYESSADNGNVLTFDKDSVALSGYNRNLTLNISNKDVKIGGFGTALDSANTKWITSGSLAVDAKSLALTGDITTTHRDNANSTAKLKLDKGDVKLTAQAYTLAPVDTEVATAKTITIDTNADSANTATGSPGSIQLNSSRYNSAATLSGNDFSLVVNAASSDPATVDGGNISADLVTIGTTTNSIKNLSFTTNSLAGTAGKVDLTGNEFSISGDFLASGAVTMNGFRNDGGTNPSTFKIATNTAETGDSGSITFNGYSLNVNKNYGEATFDSSSTSGKAGDITLWDSKATQAHASTVSVGQLTVTATGTTDGAISVDNVTTTGRETYVSLPSDAATQLYDAGDGTITLGGTLKSTSADISVLAKTVEIANDVKIQTYNGYIGSSSAKDKTGTAGNVILGSTGATLTATGQTLEIDASAGRPSGTVGTSSFTPTHGTITINDANAAAGTEFKNLTLIGAEVTNDFTKYSATGQITLGLLNATEFTWDGVKAGSLLLLGQDQTKYTFTDATVGTLASDAISDLDVQSTSALAVGPLSYSGTFGKTTQGIKSMGSIKLDADSITVNEGASVISAALLPDDGPHFDVSLVAKGAIKAEGSNQITSGKDVTLEAASVDLGASVTVTGKTGAVGVTASEGQITVGEGSKLAGVGVTLTSSSTDATIGGIVLKANTQVDGDDAKVTLITSAGDITLAEGASLKSTATGEAVLVSAGDSTKDGNVVLEGSGPVITVATGYGVIYTGDWEAAAKDSNDGYTSLGAGHYYFGVTAAPTTDPVIANELDSNTAHRTYAYFRGEAPKVDATFNNKEYNGLGFELFNMDGKQADGIAFTGGGLQFADKVAFTDATDATKKQNVVKYLMGLDADSLVIKKFGETDALAAADVKDADKYVISAGTVSSTFGYGVSMPDTTTSNYEITPKALSVTIDAVTKVYDGKKDATVESYTIARDSFLNEAEAAQFLDTQKLSIDVSNGDAAKGTFDEQTVLLASKVTATITDAAMKTETADSTYKLTNYTVAGEVTGTGTITPKPLTVTATAEDKAFDGKTTAKAELTLDRVPVVGKDVVDLVFTEANFDTSKVGTKKTVTASGLSLTGADATNYMVKVGDVAPSTEVTTTASILPIDLPAVSVAPVVPAAAPFVPPNLGNAPVLSVGTLAVVNVNSSASGSPASSPGGTTNVTIEALLTGANILPNQVYVVDGGIKTGE